MSEVKAVAIMQVEIMVEVDDVESLPEIRQQAQDIIKERIRDAKNFYPYRCVLKTVYHDTNIEDFRYRTEVPYEEVL